MVMLWRTMICTQCPLATFSSFLFKETKFKHCLLCTKCLKAGRNFDPVEFLGKRHPLQQHDGQRLCLPYVLPTEQHGHIKAT